MEKEINNDEEIMVSITCLTYNHEPYIRDCLDGFVMQKTNFKFEVLIHDDASTDGTADIIREYEAKYPDIIKPIYQTENQYSQKKPFIRLYQYPRIQGKYLAWCEGDDYWTDPNKLQKQFNFMEKHSECSMCLHKVDKINTQTGDHIEYIPAKSMSEVITAESFFNECIKAGYLFQTSSYFISFDCYKEYMENMPKFRKVINVGDVPMLYYFITKGSFGYIDDVMSCYRSGVAGSWNERNKKNVARYLTNAIEGYNMLYEYNLFTNKKYENQINELILKQSWGIYYFSILYGTNGQDITKYIGSLSAWNRKKIKLSLYRSRLIILLKKYNIFPTKLRKCLKRRVE